MVTLEITCPIASDWPNRNELNARNAVEDALRIADIGICTGAGGGMGWMDLAYRVDDEATIPAARAVIDEAMSTHMPGVVYHVRVS